jgi:hypothetical protein
MNNDIYFVSYQCDDGELEFAAIESHCRIAAINNAVLAEAKQGREIVCGVAELLCPGKLLANERK